MSIASLVELYRKCGRPTLEEGSFCYSGKFPDVSSELAMVKSESTIDFDYINVDGEEILDDDLPESGRRVDFSILIPASSSNTFHESINSLIESDPKINRGHLPEDYYIIGIDYYSKDKKKNEVLIKLEKICALIRGLSSLAHYHDEKDGLGSYRLVFVKPSTEEAGTAVLETKITEELVKDSADLDLSIIDAINSVEERDDPHHYAKINVFSVCLTDFIKSAASPRAAFDKLVYDWGNFLENYHKDVGVYISGFAFQKVKIEVANAESHIAGDFSKILGDITGKLLALPVSLIGVAVLAKYDSLFERLIIIAAMFMTSFVLFLLISNQKRHMERVIHAKDLVFSSLEGKRHRYPKDLSDSIEKMFSNISDTEKNLKRNLLVFSILSWVPFLFSIASLFYIYRLQLSDVVTNYWPC